MHWQCNPYFIIDATESFCKGTKLAKLLRELKSTPVSYNKKICWFFSHVCNGKFAVLWVLCCGINCKWVLFPSIDIVSIGLHRSLKKYNRLFTACTVKTVTKVYSVCVPLRKKRHCIRVHSFLTVNFCLPVLHCNQPGNLAFIATKVEERHISNIRHISNTSGYFF